MTTPIQTLVVDRCRELWLRKQDVVRRVGYTNLSKGCRRFDELLGGELHTTRGLLDMLPVALDLPPETAEEANKLLQKVREAGESAWTDMQNATQKAFEQVQKGWADALGRFM